MMYRATVSVEAGSGELGQEASSFVNRRHGQDHVRDGPRRTPPLPHPVCTSRTAVALVACDDLKLSLPIWWSWAGR